MWNAQYKAMGYLILAAAFTSSSPKHANGVIVVNQKTNSEREKVRETPRGHLLIVLRATRSRRGEVFADLLPLTLLEAVQALE